MEIKEKRIKIGILDHSLEIGGAEASILTLLKNYDTRRFYMKTILMGRGRFSQVLKEMNMEATILPLPSTLRTLKRGQVIKSFFLFLFYFFTFKIFLLRLQNLIKREGFDLLMTNTIKAHFYGSLISLYLRIPLIWRFHDILSGADFHPFYIKTLVFLGNYLPQQILGVSEAVRESLIRQGLHSEKVKVIYNGVDIKISNEDQKEKPLITEREVEKKGQRIGCLGRIVPQKGHRILLSSIPMVIESYPHTKFFIAGETPETYQFYKEELSELIQRMGLFENVQLMDFHIDLYSIYKSIDILVFPSLTPESFGLVILEAMAFGKPVIASRVGGVSELVIDKVNGFLVEPGNHEQLADRIKYLLGRPEVCKEMGERGREIAQEKFGLKKYVMSMEESFLNILKKRREMN